LGYILTLVNIVGAILEFAGLNSQNQSGFIINDVIVGGASSSLIAAIVSTVATSFAAEHYITAVALVFNGMQVCQLSSNPYCFTCNRAEKSVV
jgi:hypothetical protein